MRIGYACLTLGRQDVSYRGCLAKNATPSILTGLIEHNLTALERAIDYNISTGIGLFRITSDLIPFGSSPVNLLPWWQLFAPQLRQIGARIREAGIRVSLHPGQYTVLNALRPEVVQRAEEDLAYHGHILDSLELGPEHKIVLHVGGVYGDKPAALARFEKAWRRLDANLRSRIVIENDDRCYTIAETLALGTALAIPVVFDNLHHLLNPSGVGQSNADWVSACRLTWHAEDGPQKIHYSQQDPLGKPGAHARTIEISRFLNDLRSLPYHDLDIMLEVKDKDLSARKCIICAAASFFPKVHLPALEQEWRRYKYLVLERDPGDYLIIRRLLADKRRDSRLPFYQVLEHALAQAPTSGHAENAALHVWGYFKKTASGQEHQQFFNRPERFMQGRLKLTAVKQYLRRLAEKYDQAYLLDSYYFMDL